MKYLLLSTAILSLISLEAFGDTPLDTLSRQLDEVVVTARKPAEDIIPAQTLSGKELHRLNSNSVADALRYFSGVQVKDKSLFYQWYYGKTEYRVWRLARHLSGNLHLEIQQFNEKVSNKIK